MFEALALYVERKLPLKHAPFAPVRYRIAPAPAVRVLGKSVAGSFVAIELNCILKMVAPG